MHVGTDATENRGMTIYNWQKNHTRLDHATKTPASFCIE